MDSNFIILQAYAKRQIIVGWIDSEKLHEKNPKKKKKEEPRKAFEYEVNDF